MTPPSPPPPSGGHSGQWGLSALLLALVVLLAFPLLCFLLAGAMIGVADDPFVEGRDIAFGVLAVQVLAGGVLALAGVALLCAGVGFVSGLVRRQPLGLSVGGGVAAVVAVAFAVIFFLAMLRCVEWTLSYQQTHFDANGKRLPANLAPR